MAVLVLAAFTMMRYLNLQDLRQSQLPRWVALQLHCRAEQNQQIGLAANMIAQLRINQIHIDLLLPDITLLRHLG